MDASAKADYGPQLNAVIWLLISVSAVFLFTRLYLKNCQNRGLWWDDWILLASWLALTAQAGLIAHVVGLGYGKQFIPLQNLPFFGLPVNILSTLLIIANLWGKTSFAVTLLRLPVRWIRICVWCILVSMTVTLTASVILVWVECSPFKLPRKCVPVEVSIKYNVFSCAYSALMDVVLAFLPWKWIWSLQMSTKEKAGVLIAMTMGVFAGAAAAVKSTTIPGIIGGDARASIPLLVWGNAEAAICVMAASIPILRFLARGKFRVPVPGGYETGQTMTMTESGFGMSASMRTQTLPIQSPPTARRDNRDMPGQTLGHGSSAVIVPKSDDDSSDEDSIELANYQGRPQSPIDFTRPYPI
ncbi:hypothetical protein MMYC01_208728 [Madurella mycetomatis]|uniref:Rhodopsin domain-containing protein n=1 Tax=Madurella mycetomatis TaxID=100816 RepID=A0A175VS12_9PEZI|nr:hypothetical protein MMYC01_208728 [Madurella mycetomatis]